MCVAVCRTDEDKIPSISFEMNGGAVYDVIDPILVFDMPDVKNFNISKRQFIKYKL